MAEMTGRKGGTSFDEESGNYVYYARNQTASSCILDSPLSHDTHGLRIIWSLHVRFFCS